MTHVLQIGNFDPPHSTENHLRQALQANRHDVTGIQENHVDAWVNTDSPLWNLDPDSVVVWTRTGWDWASLAIDPAEMHTYQLRFLERCEQRGVPTVGYHLDRWWGLGREHEIAAEPFFRCQLVITADGGHDAEWKAAGVNHHWLPPGVSEFECQLGTPDEAYASDVAFVGSWQPGYHAEWTHRPQLVEYLRSWYGDRVRFWPPEGQPAVRGAQLRDLYASTKVNVGDSCLVPPISRYWSDRVPETLGRGGLLIHPYVEGIEDHFFPGVDLFVWKVGEWDDLHGLIEYVLTHPDAAAQMRRDGRRRVLNEHTYTVRMRQVWQLLGLAG